MKDVFNLNSVSEVVTHDVRCQHNMSPEYYMFMIKKERAREKEI